MASIANTRTANGGAGKAPISTHPAFPAIVALWFSALLGLGSMVLPPALFESAVEVTGISSFIPAATPPLGFTARALIAVAAAISGAVVGLVMARRIAISHDPRPERRFDPTSVTSSRRKPLSAHDELDEDGITDPLDDDADYAEPPSQSVAPAGKRRTLAIAEENARSTYLYSVPLPGQNPNEDYGADSTTAATQDEADEVSTIPEYAPRAVNDFSLPPTPVAERFGAAVEDEGGGALELGEFAETMADTEISTGAVVDREKQEQRLVASVATSNAPQQELARQDFSMNDSHNLQPFTSGSQDEGEHQEFAPFSQHAEEEPAPATEASNPPQDEPDGEPLPFAAPSLQRLKEVEEQAEIGLEEFEEEEIGTQSEDTTGPTFAPNLIAVPVGDADAQSECPVGHAPLDELGLVQLAERLGLSIERRRAWLAEHEADSGFALPRGGVNLADLEDAADPDEAARAMADYFGPRVSFDHPAVETPPSSTSFDIPHEYEPDEVADAHSEPDLAQEEAPQVAMPRIPASLSNVSLDDDDEDEDEDEDEDDFASSLSLPLGRHTFAAAEEPAQAAPAPAFTQPAAQDEDDDDEEEDEGEYSSLLTMKNPFERRSEFVRIEEPEPEEDEFEPAVTFPSAKAQASLPSDQDFRPFDRPADPSSVGSRAATPAAGASPQQGDRHATERDLRSALAALQRMSGAA